ncbi:MAG: hypothetical protein V2A71_07560 [Candidatus Eisenbacteria bacterium]
MSWDASDWGGTRGRVDRTGCDESMGRDEGDELSDTGVVVGTAKRAIQKIEKTVRGTVVTSPMRLRA